MTTEPTTLPGEGDIQIVKRTRVRIECDECGEPATKRHTYMLPNYRSNPASSGYRRDDCTYCSDAERFTCNDCKEPRLDGYGWGATFTASARNAHMFLRWAEEKVDQPAAMED